jgi:hypothetical protein
MPTLLAQTSKQFIRGYIQSFNFTLQKDLRSGWIGQVGYVGTHSVHLNAAVNANYGLLGGGPASQPLFGSGITSPVTINQPAGFGHYNSLQATLRKRMARGFSMAAAFTWSKQITQSTSILIPEYMHLGRSLDAADRPFNLNISGSYDLPFGKSKPYLQHGVLGVIAGGWSVNGLLSHLSGTPFSITASATSCNCPGNTQRVDQVKASVDKVGAGIGGQAYFDPLAFAQITAVRFGTAGFNDVRGPGFTNLDMGLFRSFPITERVRLQIRGESLNISNTKHLANPGATLANMSLNTDGSIRNLGGFSQITQTLPQGRLIDSRYFRFGVRIMF